MGFERKVPSSVGDLKTYLEKVHQNASHVRTVQVNLTNGHLEIDLDSMANFAGYPDIYMPIKRAKLAAAKELVERLMRLSASGFPPSDADAEALFDLIDQHGG